MARPLDPGRRPWQILAALTLASAVAPLGVAHAADGPASARAAEASKAAIAAAQADDLERALAGFTRSLELSRADGDRLGEAKALNNIGLIRVDRREPREAVPFYEQAIAAWQALGDKANEARSTENLGIARRGLGEFRKAIALLERALAIFRGLGDRPAEGQVLVNLASAHRQAGEPREALALFLEARPLVEATRDRDRLAFLASYIAETKFTLRDPEGALAALDESLAVRRAMGDPKGQAKCLGFQALIRRSRSEFRAARDLDLAAVELCRASNDLAGRSAALKNLGLDSERLGEVQASLRYHLEALQLSRELKDHAGEAELLFLVGLAYRGLFDFPNAERYYRQAIGRWEGLKDRAGEAKGRTSLGFLLSMRGDNDRATEEYEKALALYRATADRAGEADALEKLGDATTHRGATRRDARDVDRGVAYYEQALPIFRSRKDRLGEAQVLRKLALAVAKTPRRGEAAAILARAIAEARQAAPPPPAGGPVMLADDVQAVFHLSAGLAHATTGDDRRAIEEYGKAREIARRLGNRDVEADALDAMGGARERLGEAKPALDDDLAAVALWESIRDDAGLEEIRAGLADRAADAYQRALLLRLRLGDPSGAFDLSERARARTFLDQLGAARTEFGAGAAADRLAEERAARSEAGQLDRQVKQMRAGPAPGPDEKDKWTKELVKLEAKLDTARGRADELLTRIKLDDPGYASIRRPVPLTLADVRSRLDGRTTLVSYFVTPQKTVAFVVSKGGVEAVDLPAAEAKLASDIDTFLAFGAAEASKGASARLHAALVAPVRARLTTPYVALVPHGVLHRVLFAALWDGRAYFGDEFTLYHLPSASALQAIRAGGAVDRDPLVMAESEPESLPLLPSARAEAEAVAAAFGARPLLDAGATEAAFRDRCGSAGLIHLAAHGELIPGAPASSRIVLAPGGGQDGSLEVREILGLDLKRADLVVLSACNAQRGPSRGGGPDGGGDLAALSLAFLSRGASTVVASPRKVGDGPTFDLMRAFYSGLKRGLPKAEALRAAQAEVRRAHPSPGDWAAFVLSGDPGPPGP